MNDPSMKLAVTVSNMQHTRQRKWLISVPSLDSDGPFRRGPLVDFTEDQRPGYKSNRNNQYVKKKSEKYKHNASKHTEGRNSYICRRRVKFIFCNRVIKIRNKHINSKIKSANNRSKNVIHVVENKVFHKELAKNNKRCDNFTHSLRGFFNFDSRS